MSRSSSGGVSNAMLGAALIVIAALATGLVFALNRGQDAVRYPPSDADGASGTDPPVEAKTALKAASGTEAPPPAADPPPSPVDPAPLPHATNDVAGRLFTSTGDETEDEKRIAQAKLMGLGHQPKPADAPDDLTPPPTPVPTDPPPAEEEVAGPIGDYLQQLETITAGLSMGDESEGFAQSAVKAAQNGDSSSLTALKKRYEDASREVLALHSPPGTAEHKAATLKVFANAIGMLGTLVVAISAGDMSALADIGNDAKELKRDSDRVDALTVELKRKAAAQQRAR